MSVLPLSLPSKPVSPRTVTRGESPKERGASPKTVIDWLTATFEKPAMSVQCLISLLADYCGCNLRGMDCQKGFRGFETCIDIEACINDAFVKVGCICFGGSVMRGRWMLQLEGKGCGLVQDWESLQDLLEGFNARLTRTDLAADFLDGEHTVDEAVDMYRAGEFNLTGRPPESDTTGDWLTGEKGRTLYIGKRQNGKMMCVYEKGKQLGDLQSSWTRFELRLGNRDRDIPLDILTNPDKYFAGAYPALQAILGDIEGERIATISKEAQISLAHLLYHAKRCYGKAFSTFQKVEGCTLEGLIESVTVSGIPRRLEPAAIGCPVTWDDLQSSLERIHS